MTSLPLRLTALLSVSTLLASSLPTAAALIAYDPFLSGSNSGAGEYVPGSLAGQNPTVTGYLAAWYSFFGDASAVASGLAYANASGTVVSAGGSAQASSDCWMRRYFAAPITHASTGTVYVSFMLKLQ